MGCCLSKRTEEDSISTKAKAKAKGEKYNPVGSGSRDPPPTESPHDEEKVKEVLSETPKFSSIQTPVVADAARPSPNPNPNPKTKQSDDDDQYLEMRSEVESTTATAASEQSTTTTATTTTNYSTFADVQKARADQVEEDDEAMKKARSRSVLTAPSPAKVAQNRRMKKKKKVNYNQAACTGRREMVMRGSVVDVGCRSARSSPSPQRRATGGNTEAGVTRNNDNHYYCNRSPANTAPLAGTAMKRSDLGERSGRRSVSPSASASASAMKRSAAASPAMDQRQCRLMSSSSSAAAATTSSSISSRVNNERYSSPQRIPATTSRLVHSRELVVGPATATATARPSEQEDPDPAANGSCGKLLEAPRPLDKHDHEHRQGESLENPLVSLECFIFL